ncbi:hypothetical protein [Catenisphaera adipataccumulans]|jgi:hypothetical protein|uniref:FeoB-associated Cys-rich membrane protein n=1 Tax=Catenisphaera adipataccumulans TaxID=700500 RepID=A0A7W8CZK4_9FIRM|nr:hypothetical protein [Catenisphaera adipataccumulans]MBB5183259.1 hypothetical protein [Catenisphaera adipataccumulans]
MALVYGILFLGALVGIYIFLYIQNKKTPVPKGCENLKADCEGCKITSCSLRDKKLKEEK